MFTTILVLDWKIFESRTNSKKISLNLMTLIYLCSLNWVA